MEESTVDNGTASKSQPITLTPLERLTLENLYLKVENVRLQQERLQQDFATSRKMLVDLQKEAKAYESELKEKYGDIFPAAPGSAAGRPGP